MICKTPFAENPRAQEPTPGYMTLFLSLPFFHKMGFSWFSWMQGNH